MLAIAQENAGRRTKKADVRIDNEIHSQLNTPRQPMKSPVRTTLFHPLLALTASVALGGEPETVQRRAAVMGTWLSVELEAPDRASGLAASEKAFEAVRRAETRLSTWGETSELARFNRSAVGVAFDLSDELRSEFEQVTRLWRETDGCFDPGIGALVEAWGLRSGGRKPSEAEVATGLAPSGLESLELEGSTARRLHAALRIEEGGFGKGSALDAAIDALDHAGVRAAIVDLGGQVSILGKGAREISVAHPRRRESPAVVLTIDHGSLATSGNSERAIEVDGVERAHILDPRTGDPAPNFGSVSVWAGDGLSADALSTALFVMGPDRALTWATAHDGIEVLVLQHPEDSSGALRVRATPGLAGRLRAAGEQLDIEYFGGDENALPLPPTDETLRPISAKPFNLRSTAAESRQ